MFTEELYITMGFKYLGTAFWLSLPALSSVLHLKQGHFKIPTFHLILGLVKEIYSYL